MVKTDKWKLLKGKRNEFKPFDIRLECDSETKSFGGYWIPSLVYNIHLRYGYAISDIVSYISDLAKQTNESYFFNRTSEIFVTKNTRGGRLEKRRLMFYPLGREGAYMSHIVFRKKYKKQQYQ